ncbi:MAG TPA: MmcQ/YjbR family DNA-binding protein [Candidatus Ornithomonoglobus intestinigallinarum]|uniref:MmcQ/YjbR family DNA-binding protein n=1 Tax=Candidatus Ornithomonoglobus intestinigallinarum TaxID=2840894 RepID=A0A9D1H2R1_9FIRM|nr:MmcQ/YjbR family DNA-binding protein [Candidatus Ornithomonoglobus intestinigallinarum]
MTREELAEYIENQYGVQAEHPWADAPGYAVFRHGGNRKWFAVIMNVPADRLGLKADGEIDIVNLKCDPLLVDLLKRGDGFFAAYHMNKEHWISAALGGNDGGEKIKPLLDASFLLTAPKTKNKKSRLK